MNFGTSHLETKIWEQISQCGGKFNAGIKGGNRKFVKDLADRLMKFLEENGGDMHSDIKIRAKMYGIPDEVINYAERICRAFAFETVQLTPLAVGVYEWMMEQEQKGQTVEKFAEWARMPDRAKYINKYRKDAGNFKNDWVLAFESVSVKGGGYDEVSL